MSKDPFWEREQEKYGKPVPSREFILMHLEKRDKPPNRDELAEELNVLDDEQKEALRRRLRAMERDGQVIFTRRQRYVVPERLDLMRGRVIGHRDGYGFLRVEGEKDDLYLSAEQMRFCLHGDIILAQHAQENRKGRREARVVRVLEPRVAAIVGRYFMEAGVGIVVPDDSRLHFDILIPPQETMNARVGSMVVVELTQRPKGRAKIIGKIIEVLGENMSTSLAMDMALRTHDIPWSWPPEVDTYIESLSEYVTEEAKIGRVDLRKLPLITIDGEDARDFDDAVYCETKSGGGWRLWVAIADVSYYVRPHSPLDKAAYERGTSVYFPSRVVPMLPEVLSNGLCSLNPDVDRLCFVCEMTLSASGKLTSYRHYEAVMNSHARLTYNKVWNILRGDKSLRERYASLVPVLETLQDLYRVLEKSRHTRGSIAFETQESRFIFNAEKRIERVEPVVRNDAHKIIEECMILANIASARFVEKHKEPALFRDHDYPSEENVTRLRSVLSELGLSLPGGIRPQPLDYARFLESIMDRPDFEMLQTMLLRSMKQAIYDPENRGHFGLALKSYAHFTSPIRRYPDLLLHRAIKSLLTQQKNQNDKVSLPSGAYHYDLPTMTQYGQHCSMTERRADEATREVADWLKCDFMRDQVGNQFTGIIVSVTTFGFFVRLNDLFIEGLVHVSSLDNDYYHFDAVGQRLTGGSGGQVYRLGDTVEVRVEAVHMDERKIDFMLLTSHRRSRGKGKTAKNNAKITEKEKTSPSSSGKKSQSQKSVASSQSPGKKGKQIPNPNKEKSETTPKKRANPKRKKRTSTTSEVK